MPDARDGPVESKYRTCNTFRMTDLSAHSQGSLSARSILIKALLESASRDRSGMYCPEAQTKVAYGRTLVVVMESRIWVEEKKAK